MKKAFAMVLLLSSVLAAYNQDGNLKKQTYMRIGYSLPSWRYFGFDGKSDWTGNAKRVGGVFEVGSIFMLNSIKLAPNMRLGINVDYLSVNYHKLTNENYIGNYSNNFLYIGSKIGPSFSYSPVKRLVLDAFVKFNPVWIDGDYIEYDGDTQFYLGYFGIKYSVGMNVRYSLLMVGIDFNPGFAKMRRYDEDAGKLTDEYLENSNDNGRKVPVPGLNFTIGLSF